MKDEPGKNPIQVAGRLFGVLEMLADRREASLGEISEELGLNKSTAHRVLSSLAYMDYVKQADNGKYQLSLKIVELSNRIVEVNKENILSIVYPCLHSLALKTGETVHFVQRDGIDAVYVAKMEPSARTTTTSSRIGSHVPLYRSGVGKAISSTMAFEMRRELWERSNVIKATKNTITDFNVFNDCVERAKMDGYAIDDEENELGIKCVAAAIRTPFDVDGVAQYAFSVTGPENRVRGERCDRIATMVLEAKDEIDEKFK